MNVLMVLFSFSLFFLETNVCVTDLIISVQEANEVPGESY
jgi:hypothetical protein